MSGYVINSIIRSDGKKIINVDIILYDFSFVSYIPDELKVVGFKNDLSPSVKNQDMTLIDI